jgi:hypothetical protein
MNRRFSGLGIDSTAMVAAVVAVSSSLKKLEKNLYSRFMYAKIVYIRVSRCELWIVWTESFFTDDTIIILIYCTNNIYLFKNARLALGGPILVLERYGTIREPAKALHA